MEESRYLKNPGDSLIIESRQNDNGDYTIVNPEFEFGGVISSEASVTIYFRTLSHGVITTDWVEVGTQVQSLQQFELEYSLQRGDLLQIRLVRAEDSVVGYVEFIRFFTNGTFILSGRPTPTIDASIFGKINKEQSTMKLENNLFKKLYFRGILPNYIERGENLDANEDKDFISLFSAIARFFALIIKFFKRWENINSDEEILKEILRNNGIQFNESEITLDELKTLVSNRYNEFNKRGTKEIFLLAGEQRTDGTSVSFDGELMRTIRAKAYTEVLFEDIPKTSIGWYLGKSSPIYRGIANDCYALNKIGVNSLLYSSLEEFQSAFAYLGEPTLGSGRDNQDGYTINWGDGCGIGRTSVSVEDIEGLVSVDPCMDYEITFAFKVLSVGTTGGKLYAFVEGFNRNKVKLLDSFIMPDKSNVVMNAIPDGEYITCGNFFNSEGDKYLGLSNLNTSADYYVRFIIKAYSSKSQTKYGLNIGIGNELHFNNYFVRYILPSIVVKDANIEVFNIHMRPLVRGTNINQKVGSNIENCFSLGFLQTSHFSHLYMRNGNTTMTEDGVKNFIDKYLLPYNGANLITFIK